MPVDHGFVQMWEAVLGDFRSVPDPADLRERRRTARSDLPPRPATRRIRRSLRDAFGQEGTVRRLRRSVARPAAAGDHGRAPGDPRTPDQRTQPEPGSQGGAREARARGRCSRRGGQGTVQAAQSGMGPGVHGYPAKRRDMPAPTRSIPTRCERRRAAAPTKSWHGSPPSARSRPEAVSRWSRNSTKPSPAGSPAWR